jgi:hypothetical protein
MKNIPLKSLIPYLSAVVIFITVSLVYLSPLLEGKKLNQADISRHKGMSKEITDFRNETGDEALWTNSMFGGMPAYQISVRYNGNLVKYFDKIMRLGLPRPADFVFLYMIGFFILLLVLGVNPWLSIAGAIAYGFSSYFFIILEAGHNSKAHAIGYMAPVIAGFILAYRGKYMAGGILTLLFLALEIRAGHPQMTYYLALLLLIFGIVELIGDVRSKRLLHFVKASSAILVAVVIAVLTHTTSLWATWEYGKATIRGKSELSTDQENRTSGLDKDYATAWSYGVAETGTLLIPNFHGGSSMGKLSTNSETYNLLVQNNIPRQQAEAFIKGAPTYWGTQPFTSGPVYLGAIVIFLFVFGLFVLKGPMKWWLVAGTIFSILLSWGKNFMPLTEFFLDYFPGYNKFRAVSMTLVMAEITIPILAFVGLNEIFNKDRDQQKLIKSLLYSFYIVGGFLLVFVLLPGAFFDFKGGSDAQLPEWLRGSIIDDRKSLLRMDALRSLMFVLLSGGILWAFLKGKLKASYVFVLLILLVLVDMWPVNKRYLGKDNFVSARKAEVPFTKTSADELILKDKDPNFRVLNLTVDPFADARTSYFHKSVGGYHGAKLRRYQELYDHQIQQKFNMDVLNMLNTKYIIQPDKNNKPVVTPNMAALGNAWFVEDYVLVNNADEELAELSNFDPEKLAVVDKRFKGELEGFTLAKDSLASIKLIDYKPNHLQYQSNTSKDQLAVFSEIYYDKGWNAYLDGARVPHFRVNYVLRGMIMPAGKHLVEFKFEPKVYKVGEKISFASSLLLIILVVGYGVFEIKKYLRKEGE